MTPQRNSSSPIYAAAWWKVFFVTTFLLAAAGSSRLEAQIQQVEEKFRGTAKLLAGNWHGAGIFSSGRKIAANATIQYDSLSHALTYHHVDEAPATWNCLAVWSVSKSDSTLVVLFADGFSGGRIFRSDEWGQTRIVLKRSFTKQGLPAYERFIYEILHPTEFKMTWETSQDGLVWKMGDYLIFDKTPSQPDPVR